LTRSRPASAVVKTRSTPVRALEIVSVSGMLKDQLKITPARQTTMKTTPMTMTTIARIRFIISLKTLLLAHSAE
jgi:hypothetical protein